MEAILIKENSPEWEYMWEWLAAHPLNEGLEEPSVANNELNDEKWRYRLSYRQIEGDDIKVLHEFMHKSHPKTGDKEKLVLWASPNMNAEDILKTMTIES